MSSRFCRSSQGAEGECVFSSGSRGVARMAKLARMHASSRKQGVKPSSLRMESADRRRASALSWQPDARVEEGYRQQSANSGH